MDLQPLFPEPIVAQTPFTAAYADHTNDVWRVRTATEDVVVRAPRRPDEWDHAASAFWRGCRDLFGLDPTRPERLLAVNDLLARRCPLPVPRALRAGRVAGRPCVVVERLPGARVDDLRALPPATLRALGGAVATLHRERRPWFGPLDAARGQPLADFHPALAATMRLLIAGFYGPESPLAAPLERCCAAALALPAPTWAAPVMLDVDATQFLAEGGRLTGLIDTDAYAYGPPALDLLGYEYELDAPSAAAFADGYRAVAPLPALAAVRPVYRYFFRLLGTQGAVPLDEWLAWPDLFGAGG